MSEFRDDRQDARLDALERRLRAVLDHLGLEDPVSPAPAGVSRRVAELALAGATVQAIRAHMEDTGADMRTARDAVAAVIPAA